MVKEKFVAILKYMDLRIKGFGAGLSEGEIKTLQDMTKDEDDALYTAIVELGGTLPEGLKVPTTLSKESKAFLLILKGMWIHGHEWAVQQVRKSLGLE